MEKLVSLEIAKILRVNGYDEPTEYYYLDKDLPYEPKGLCRNKHGELINNNMYDSFVYSAPTLIEANRWSKSKGIVIENIPMIRVILESPYAGDVERNLAYARMAVKDSLLRGEAPIASHLLYTQEGILDDNVPYERKLGINAGLAWKDVADKHVFYIDYGYSKGMEYAKQYATQNNIPIEERRILS